MAETEPTTAVLDRIVDGETAVFLLEEDDEVVDELTVDAEVVPEEGRRDGAVFDLVLEEGEISDFRYREEETRERRETAQERFDRLSERLDN